MSVLPPFGLSSGSKTKGGIRMNPIGLLDKKGCQPPFGVSPQDKLFGMVDLQNFENII
jgi:hypothetical protein